MFPLYPTLVPIQGLYIKMYPSEVLSSRPYPGFRIGVARGLAKDLHNAYSIIVLLSNCSSEKEEHCPPVYATAYI